MLRRNKNTGKKIAISAIIGGITGYLTGLLTAPQSGKETRSDIADKAEEVKDSAEDELYDLNDELKKMIKETKSRTVALSAQAREEFNETVVKAKDAQNKATGVLKAFKAGEASDPDLNKAVKQVKQAVKNLGKYLKS